MAKVEEIREGLEQISKKGGPEQTLLAIVKAVDVDNKTCTLLDDSGLEIFDVRLSAVLTGHASILIVPEVNSWALATRIEQDDEWVLSWAEHATRITHQTDTAAVEITDKIALSANGENAAQLFDDLFTAISQMVFSHPQGPTTGLVNAAQFTALKQRFKLVFK